MCMSVCVCDCSRHYVQLGSNDTLAAKDPEQRGIGVPLGATVGVHTSGIARPQAHNDTLPSSHCEPAGCDSGPSWCRSCATGVLGIEAMVYSYECVYI